MADFKGKVALVTGSAAGAGAAIAIALAAKGAGVCVNYSRSEREANETLEKVKALGVPGTIFKCDVGQDARVKALVRHTVDTLGRLDILVNNAGITHFIAHSDLDAMTEDKWDEIFRVNLKGAFFAARAAMPHLKASGAGCIVNISSIAGLHGTGSSIAYAASKSALISLTQSLARAFAPEVRVNAIAPGVILTRWVAGKDEFVKRYVERTPLHKSSTPEDIAHMAVFLAEADGVTGQTLVIDGGYTLG